MARGESVDGCAIAAGTVQSSSVRTARARAADQLKADMIAALSLICVDQSKRDPQLAELSAKRQQMTSPSQNVVAFLGGDCRFRNPA
jgi:hypothetical protein